MRGRVAAVALLALLITMLGVLPARAAGLTEQPAPPLPTPVSAAMLPTWQINGVAWSQAIVGNTVYVTGNFTKARPPGVAVGGAGEVDALNLFAYDLTTGNRVASFNHSMNAQGLVIRASADGSRIYVGGDFTAVDGQPRGHVAAFSTADGSLLPWDPNVEGQVRAIAATGDSVYVGGNFGSANGVVRGSLAAFEVSSRAIKPWAPTATGTGGYVFTMTMSPDNSRVVIGGSFDALNGVSAYGMGAVSATTGETLDWAANQRIRTAGLNGAITSLKTDGNAIFGSGYAFGTGASFEGTFSADPSNGAINWVNDCLGDTYDTFPMDQVLYSVSHAHNCSAINEFPDTSPRSRWMKATAAPTYATGTITNKDAYGWDFRGLPYAGLLQWYPDLEFGTKTPDRQAAWSVTGSGNYVALAGEFPMVNGVAQQGLVRFAYRGVKGPSQKPIYNASMIPTPTSTEAGTVRVTWQTTWDRDDKALTYDIYRDNGPSIATLTSPSIFWNMPRLGFVDTGRTPGATHTYKVRVKDSDGNVQWSIPSAPVTVSDAPVSAYTAAVRADGASHLWRLGDTGPAAVDAVAFADLTSAGVTFGANGAISGDTAVSSGGGTAPKLAIGSPEAKPQAATVEAWVNTTSTAGGRIAGFGDQPLAGTSSAAGNDLVLYLANTGKANFAVNGTVWRGVQSAKAINDGQWHHVVGVADATGIALYVDGRLVGRDANPVTISAGKGYWRLLADQTSGLPNRPTNAGLAGSIDEVAVYPTALPMTTIRQHYVGSGRTQTWPNATATDAYSTAVLASTPDAYWRLDETQAGTVADASTMGQNATASGNLSYGASGAISGNAGMSFLGTNSLVVSQDQRTNPSAYTTELWFNTTTTRGGKLVGFGNAASGTSASVDRQVCLLNTGKLQFGAYDGVQQKIETAASYNDGRWHHLVASQGADGMKLYVDSVLVGTNPSTRPQNYAGFWRVGGDKCWGGVSNSYVVASLDEVAIYDRVLTQDEVDSHYAASGRLLPNKLPTAAITASTRFLAASLDATSSIDRDGTITGYAWTFGDGSTGTGATATHTYAAAGTYRVTLTVTDDRGASASTTRDVVVVANQAPTAQFSATSTFLSTAFDAGTSTDVDGTITGYAWDFGDGSTGTGATATHVYAAAGSYEVTLTATDDAGATSTQSQTVTVVANQAPTASFSTATSMLALNVDASASADAEGPIASYAWTFGDGSTGVGALAQHTYANDGIYDVTLTVTDGAGATAVQTQTVTVAGPPNQLPTASFTVSPAYLAMQVDASASADPDGSVVSYAWDFGDGSSGSGRNASHTYAAAGTYPVSVTVTDNRGGQSVATQTVTVVANAAPVASFTSTATWLTVSVDAAASADPDGTIASYQWTFGDGSSASGRTATHTYAAPGTYAVTLRVTDNGGQSSTASATVTVAADPAFAADLFERTANGGWGTADVGGAWALSGTLSRYTVANGQGRVSLGAGASAAATLAAMAPQSDVDIAVTMSSDRVASGGGLYYSVIGRQVSATSDYRAKIKVAAGGAVSLYLTRTDAGVETVLQSAAIANVVVAQGDRIRVRMQISGTSPTTISAKVWKVGDVEPTGWAVTGTDSSANLQTAGRVGLYSYVSGSATGVPVVVMFDDLWAGPLQP